MIRNWKLKFFAISLSPFCIHKINLSGLVRDFLFVSHPNHLLLAGVNNRNVIITQRFHVAPDQAN